MIDLYCERTGPGLWAEPLNTVTNVAFFVVAFLLRRLIQEKGIRSQAPGYLVYLIAVLGLGSVLFHLFATRWAQALDVIPILLFQTLYLWYYTTRVASLDRRFVAAGLGLYVLVALVTANHPDVLFGSLGYVPGLIVLSILGICHVITGRHGRDTLTVASALYLAAVCFRSVDRAVCGAFPVGTHFIWHVLAAAVMYLAMKVLVLNWMED